MLTDIYNPRVAKREIWITTVVLTGTVWQPMRL